MQTLDPVTILSDKARGAQSFIIEMKCVRRFLPLAAGMLLIFVGSCSKDPGMEAIETDANGYLCLKCGAKFYTDRKVFLEKCPKCKQDSLADATGYMCKKDHHLTVRPKVSGSEGASVCELCGMNLKNAMFEPHKKDLEAWGATKAGLPQAH